MRQRSCDSVNTLLCLVHFDQLFVPNLTPNLTHKSPFFTPFLAEHHKNSFLVGLRSVGFRPPYSASPSSPFYDPFSQIFAPGTLTSLNNLHPLSRTQSLVQGVRRECDLHATAFMRQRCFLSRFSGLVQENKHEKYLRQRSRDSVVMHNLLHNCSKLFLGRLP